MPLAYALLALAALLFGLCAKEARVLACLFWANWLLCFSSYYFVPAVIQSEALWTVADLVCACAAIACAGHRRWGWALWGLWTFQCCYHVVAAWGLVDDGSYSDALDAVFVLQAGVFLLVGGRDARDLLSEWVRRLRRLGGSPRYRATAR